MSTRNGGSLKLVYTFTNLGRWHQYTTNEGMENYWLVISFMDVGLIKWNEIQFFPSSGRIYTTIWMYNRDADLMYWKKLDGNCTRMLRAIMNKCWKQHPWKQQLHGHLPPLSNTILIWRTRYAGHCRRSKGEHISGVFRRTPLHGRTSATIDLLKVFLPQFDQLWTCIGEEHIDNGKEFIWQNVFSALFLIV